MRKLIILTFCVTLIISCVAQKDILHPYVKFKIYDSTIKTPLSNVTLYKTDYRGSLNQHLILDNFSNKNGIIIIPKSEIRLVGSTHRIMPLTSIKYVFKKNGYVNLSLDLHTYFNINSKKDLKKRYNTHIYLTKIETLPSRVGKGESHP